MSDDFDDIIDEMKKFFKFNSNLFDVDFFVFPESDLSSDFKLDPNDKNLKGFKVSYHFETGMDKPEIKIEGDIDEKKLEDYVKKMEQNPRFKKLIDSRSKGDIDASELSLEPHNSDDKSSILEPYSEITDFDDFTEIIIEVPGIKKDYINLSFNNDGRMLTFSAQNQNRRYLKKFDLPFKSSMEDYSLDVNNGIATLIVRKRSK